MVERRKRTDFSERQGLLDSVPFGITQLEQDTELTFCPLVEDRGHIRYQFCDASSFNTARQPPVLNEAAQERIVFSAKNRQHILALTSTAGDYTLSDRPRHTDAAHRLRNVESWEMSQSSPQAGYADISPSHAQATAATNGPVRNRTPIHATSATAIKNTHVANAPAPVHTRPHSTLANFLEPSSPVGTTRRSGAPYSGVAFMLAQGKASKQIAVNSTDLMLGILKLVLLCMAAAMVGCNGGARIGEWLLVLDGAEWLRFATALVLLGGVWSWSARAGESLNTLLASAKLATILGLVLLAAVRQSYAASWVGSRVVSRGCGRLGERQLMTETRHGRSMALSLRKGRDLDFASAESAERVSADWNGASYLGKMNGVATQLRGYFAKSFPSGTSSGTRSWTRGMRFAMA
jgi:hypothetical protein